MPTGGVEPGDESVLPSGDRQRHLSEISDGRQMRSPTRAFGPGRIRLLNAVAACLLVVGATGWWMTTRVLNADGFADVMAKSVHDQPIRDYVADQITLHLARDTSIVAAARPIVRSALSAALDTPPVEAAVRSGAQRAIAKRSEPTVRRSQKSMRCRPALPCLGVHQSGTLGQTPPERSASLHPRRPIKHAAESCVVSTMDPLDVRTDPPPRWP